MNDNPLYRAGYFAGYNDACREKRPHLEPLSPADPVSQLVRAALDELVTMLELAQSESNDPTLHALDSEIAVAQRALIEYAKWSPPHE